MQFQPKHFVFNRGRTCACCYLRLPTSRFPYISSSGSGNLLKCGEIPYPIVIKTNILIGRYPLHSSDSCILDSLIWWQWSPGQKNEVKFPLWGQREQFKCGRYFNPFYSIQKVNYYLVCSYILIWNVILTSSLPGDNGCKLQVVIHQFVGSPTCAS